MPQSHFIVFIPPSYDESKYDSDMDKEEFCGGDSFFMDNVDDRFEVFHGNDGRVISFNAENFCLKHNGGVRLLSEMAKAIDFFIDRAMKIYNLNTKKAKFVFRIEQPPFVDFCRPGSYTHEVYTGFGILFNIANRLQLTEPFSVTMLIDKCSVYSIEDGGAIDQEALKKGNLTKEEFAGNSSLFSHYVNNGCIIKHSPKCFTIEKFSLHNLDDFEGAPSTLQFDVVNFIILRAMKLHGYQPDTAKMFGLEFVKDISNGRIMLEYIKILMERLLCYVTNIL